MAASKNLIFISMVALMASLIMCANLARASRNVIPIAEGMIEVSAEGEGGMVECGNALVGAEIMLQGDCCVFSEWEGQYGSDCCQAILTITRHCWPAMLTSLGITAEQGDILRGYCDTAAVTVYSNTSTNAPDPAAAPITNAPAAAPIAHATPLTS